MALVSEAGGINYETIYKVRTYLVQPTIRNPLLDSRSCTPPFEYLCRLGKFYQFCPNASVSRSWILVRLERKWKT